MVAVEEKISVQAVFAGQQQRVGQLRMQTIEQRGKKIASLGRWIKSNRSAIHQALHDDFRKPQMEVDAVDILPVLQEISHTRSNLHRWTKPRKVDAPLTMLGTRSFIMYEPKGVCLVLSPWNYPFVLAVGPVVSALAAGNSVIIKPSEYTPHTSALIKRMMSELFEPSEVAVITGGIEVAEELLRLPFDHVFFTGSPAVGKLVMKAAAENLTSVTLELGGKSPAIVTPTARLRDAVTRIAIAKFFNNGQTCVAPDYVVVHEAVRDVFIEQLKHEIQRLLARNGSVQQSPDYARIASDKHFQRLNELIQDALQKGATPIVAGPVDAATRFIHPTVLTGVTEGMRVMQEEIFGPVLPILTYRNLPEAIALINRFPKPLSLYLFTQQRADQSEVLSQTSAGGVCINECAIHFLNHNLPFGGVNNSGIGKSHGHYGFLAFSNEKPVLRQRNGLTTFSFFFPPYTARAKKLMDWLIRLS
jgi:aldehyde dehydrogenase (NAD+)